MEMKRKAVIALFATAAASAGLGPIEVNAAEGPSIEGRWRAMDDDLRTTRAVIELARAGEDFVGTVSKVIPQLGEDADPVCELCEGANHNRRIRGLPILFLGPQGNDGQYQGTILDPEEGRTYRCVARLEGLGNRLVLRGYIGIPLLGRTETWLRE